jgi:recombination protein RecA
MSASVVQIPGLVPAASLGALRGAPTWNYTTVAGRLAELSSEDGAGQLTLAVGLVADAHRQGEPVAWVTREKSSFFPPDAAEHGVDLESLVVVRVPETDTVPCAGEMLARSGAFGLVVLDLGRDATIPPPLFSRLGRIAQQRNTAVLCLTIKPAETPSLGSLMSLRGVARYRRTTHASFRCELLVLKDKRTAPTWTYRGDYCGPVGLC